MMLCFCNLVDPISVVIFDEHGKKIAEKSGAKKADREDLLLEIAELLEANTISPCDLKKIFVVPGPGRFSSVRSACVIANTLAQETGAELFAIDAEEFTEKNSDFSDFVLEKRTPQTRINPIFLGEMRIGGRN